MSWLNQNIPGAIKGIGDTTDELGAAQILNGVLAQRNKKIAPVSAQGGDMVRAIGDFSDGRDRMIN